MSNNKKLRKLLKKLSLYCENSITAARIVIMQKQIYVNGRVIQTTHRDDNFKLIKSNKLQLY